MVDESKYSLSELSDLLYLFGNDVRLLHLHTVGLQFFSFHKALNELYDVCYDMYDSLAEMAISHKESIGNPTEIIYDYQNEWIPISGDNFDAEYICEVITNRGKFVIECINNVDKYESFVQSKIDSFAEELDKYINYMFTQANKNGD